MVFGGGVRKPLEVVLFCAVLYNAKEIKTPDEIIEKNFGKISAKSDIFPFSHTSYYVPEMGEHLYKYFVGFDCFFIPDKIVEFKLKAVEIEDSMLKDGKRVINIDPGYVALEKVVAASTKNFTHRIYIANSIYGDVQLMRKSNSYEKLPWTFYDYTLEPVLKFFEEMRRILKVKLDG
ncbi:MAG: hypothetical protein JG767_1152 [Deferribacteraceae bacterium]|jgi:hypothetical protein|nr:hypothetical protein [Deferribacteraceae bacterium]